MLNIWANVLFTDASLARLRAGISPHHLSIGSRSYPAQAAPPDAELAQADVVFGQPHHEYLLSLPRLKWVHLSAAGYSPYDRPELRKGLAARSIRVTNSSSVYDEPCANHVLALMLAGARDLPAAYADQNGPHQWTQGPIRARSRLLKGQSVLLLGFGAIGRRLAELLGPFHMDIHAVRRSPGQDEPIPVHATTELESLLPAADHVVNLLPANTSTVRIMNAARFNLMKRGAVFYNIGRGVTVDQPALIAALAGGRLAAACLDVTDPEPLPPKHELWTTPNCFITPHSAGGHADEFDRLVEHFLENFKRFQAGTALLDQILT